MRLSIIYLFFFICSLAPIKVDAQNAPGARAAALGGTALVLEDVWSGYHNQAGLVGIDQFNAGAFYENRFGLNELSDKGVTVALPVGNSRFGLSYRSFGYNLYNQSKAGLQYAQKLSDKLSAGLQLNYYSLRLGDNYGRAGNVGFDLGFLYRYNTKLSLAAHVQNPTRSKLADFNDERINNVIRVGAGYRFSQKVILLAEVRKPENADVSVHGGLEYNPADAFSLRVGFNTIDSFSFGFGWNTSMIRVDASASVHPVIGFTPQVSLTYAPRKK